MTDAFSIPHRLYRSVRIALERAVAKGRERYEPADHYMRGPGPKCRQKELGAGS